MRPKAKRSAASTPKKKSAVRRYAVKKPTKILDAAEAIFVRRGYYGTSLRDVANAAEVPLALVSYHFSSKEGLFRAVVDRRAPQHTSDMQHALHMALSADRPSTRLETVLKAFIEPVVEKSMRADLGWKNYVRLLAQLANLPQEESFASVMPDNYESTVHIFIAAIRSIYPHMSEFNVQHSFYFFQAAITHILGESGLIDRQSNGAFHAADLDAITPPLIRFCAAGFRALADETAVT